MAPSRRPEAHGCAVPKRDGSGFALLEIRFPSLIGERMTAVDEIERAEPWAS
jgi:hypothetical protein